MPDSFRKKLQKLKYLNFQRHDRFPFLDPKLSDEDILSELQKVPRPDRYLGRYTAEEIRELLGKRSILKKLRDMGFTDISIDIETDEVYTHRLYIYEGTVRNYDTILVELRLREGFFSPREIFIPDFELGPQRMLMVDWLMLQNPKKDFTPDRPPLPRQNHPGLGLLGDLIPLVVEVARQTERAGILDTPEHYHGALFYSRWFHFFNPEMEGRFLAMQRDLLGKPLHIVSQAVYLDCLKNTATGKYEPWNPGEQILPVSETMEKYFRHDKYRELRDKAFLENRYELDLEKFEAKMKEEVVAEEEE